MTTKKNTTNREATSTATVSNSKYDPHIKRHDSLIGSKISSSVTALIVAIIACSIVVTFQQQPQQQAALPPEIVKKQSFSITEQSLKQQQSSIMSNPTSRLLLLLNDADEETAGIAGDSDHSDENHNSNTSMIMSQTLVTVFPNGGSTGGGEELTLEELISSGRTNFYDGKGRKVDLTQPIQMIRANKQNDKVTSNHHVDDTHSVLVLQHKQTKLYEAPTKPGLHFHWPIMEHLGQRIQLQEPPSPVPGKTIELEMLSHSPRVFMVHNFVSDQEIDQLKEFAQSNNNPYRMRRSTAGTHKSWANGAKNDVISTRTSTNAFDISTPTSKAIKRRSFQLLRIPKFHDAMSDGIQILRYQTKQAYVAHHDYFPVSQSQDHNWDPSKGGSNRFATVYLYMSDPEEGGHTCFPQADMNHALVDHGKNTTANLEDLLSNVNITKGSWEYKLTQDCYHKFSVRPKKGSALIFYSQLPNGKLDPKSIHGAGPVLKGPDKWGANVWVWNACRYSLCSKDKAQGGLYPTKDIDFVY